MSTKSTIAHGPTFHVYRELGDEDAVYLELQGVAFQATYNRVVVPIPVHIWETIRVYPGVDLSWAERSDEEIEAAVTHDVDERLAEVVAAPPAAKPLAALSGVLVYGDVDTPREEQIVQGTDYFKRLRAHQQEIRDAIAELRRSNLSPDAVEEKTGL